jgi:S1/P1 Nuclease
MSSAVIRTASLVIFATIALNAPAGAWDYPGHRIVGGIADAVLNANFHKTRDAVGKLLDARDSDGNVLKRSLRDVAVFPDCAKTNNVPFCGRTPSKEEVAYTSRNEHHAGYHFTDVPLEQPKYVAGIAGTEPTDAVQMINYIVAQLRGKKPQIEGVKLTNGEAVWLLAHLVGDIHQPLHIGAAYYDKETCTQRVDPNTVAGGIDNVAQTIGGNAIELAAVNPSPAAPPADNLHFFWDGAAVAAAMQAAGLLGAEPDFARLLAATPPAGWETTGDAETWAAQWVTEALPLAKKAHDDLTITLKERKVTGDKVSCTWNTTINQGYSDWAQTTARAQLAKAGFRLAALLVAIFPNN